MSLPHDPETQCPFCQEENQRMLEFWDEFAKRQSIEEDQPGFYTWLDSDDDMMEGFGNNE